MPEIVFISLFLIIFGICYLYYSTRNKERMALIEKGADASIFVGGKQERKRPAPTWKIIILNLSLLLMGIGFGILLSTLLVQYLEYRNNDPIYVGTTFLSAGIGLFIGFFMTKKLYAEALKN